MSRLWSPPLALFGPRRFVKRSWIHTMPNGERVHVYVDDSGTTTQVEHDHTLDAIVRPKTIAIKFRGS